MEFRYTPWGNADGIKVYAPGIVEVTTPSHGGIWLSPERMKAIPDCLQILIEGPWFEEDCDYAIAVLCFPACFPPKMLECAFRSAINWQTKYGFDPAAYLESETGKQYQDIMAGSSIAA